MTNFRSYLIAVFGLAVLIGAVVFSASSASHAAPTSLGPPTQDVKVVNTTAEAVPTKAQGTTTVAGTVQVGNDTNNPVLVRDVDNPALLPFTQEFFITIPDGQFQGTAKLAVDPGVRLVIEYVSGQSTRNSLFGGPIISGNIQTNSANHFFPWTDNPKSFTSVAGQLIRTYTNPSTDLKVIIDREGSNGNQDIRVSITGYFVRVP